MNKESTRLPFGRMVEWFRKKNIVFCHMQMDTISEHTSILLRPSVSAIDIAFTTLRLSSPDGLYMSVVRFNTATEVAGYFILVPDGT